MKNKGITLIALVLTIVILIILAGVSINLVLGENGLIEKAKQAQKVQEEANFEDNIKLLSLEYATALTINEDGIDNLINELEKRNYQVENLENEYLIVYDEKTNKKKVIDLSTGNVLEYEEYSENDLKDIIDTSIWDGTSSDGLIGEGTLLKPYLICSAKDFSYFRDQVNSKQAIRGLNIDKTENDKNVDANIACYKLMTDIYLNDTTNFDSWNEETEGLNNWIPIGYWINSKLCCLYSGSFNGNNHKIIGTYIKLDNSLNQKQGGIFAIINDAEISNLRVEDTYIYSAIERNGSNTLIGAIGTISGGSEGSNINNCRSINAKLHGKSYIGGIIGITKYIKTNTKLSLSNCYFNGEIQLLEITKEDSINVGGITGHIVGAVNSFVKNCYNEGNISIINESVAEVSVGGICGYVCHGTEIYNSYNTGNIKVNSTNTCSTGGILGIAYTTASTAPIIVENCYNIGNITGGTYQNGIIAYMDIAGPIKINNCYSVGNIEKENVTDGNVVLVHKPILGTRVNNSYILVKDKIYKWECLNNNADTFTEQTLSETDLYSIDFIKNTLNWDENIWNITGSNHPTLKYKNR